MASSSVGFSGSPTSTQASTGTTTPGTTGLSNYSQDLQNEVNRQVALASLPMQEVQNEVTGLTSQSTELNTLNGDFQALQTAISNLDTANQGILSPSVSNANVLSASVGAGALPGTYSVQVTQAGVSASAMSSSGVADPTSQSIDPAASFTLSVNGVGTTITPASNTLDALVSAINATGSAGVQATLVNVGSSSSPNYELSLQNTAFGDVPITLTATGSSSNLLTPLAAGADFQYKVNGFPATPLSSTSGSVTLSPGVTVSLLGTGTSAVTVAPSSASISNALSSLSTAYNSAVDELGKNIGQNGGALGGDNIVYTLQQALSDIGTYSTASIGVTSLSDVGLTFDTSGHLNFDPTVVAGASSNQVTNIASFLGSATSGGFLQFATSTLTGITDPSSGILTSDIRQTTSSIASDNQLIATQQAQITLLQTTLQAQMSKSDAAIASLESQQSFFSSLFTAMILPSPQQLSQL
jgi:flagellar hook-associated protein 2